MIGGECLCCARLDRCSTADVGKVMGSYVCTMFSQVPEPVLRARWDAMKAFGEEIAVRAMLSPLKGEEK